jgi:predicted nucleic acid-binding protein
MINLSVSGCEQEVVDLALKYNLSFYDAAYVYLAKKDDAVFVTEDGKLAKKIKTYTEVTTASALQDKL